MDLHDESKAISLMALLPILDEVGDGGWRRRWRATCGWVSSIGEVGGGGGGAMRSGGGPAVEVGLKLGIYYLKGAGTYEGFSTTL